MRGVRRVLAVVSICSMTVVPSVAIAQQRAAAASSGMGWQPYPVDSRVGSRASPLAPSATSGSGGSPGLVLTLAAGSLALAAGIGIGRFRRRSGPAAEASERAKASARRRGTATLATAASPRAARPSEPAQEAARPLFVRLPWPEGTEALWRCEIAWKAGYASSQFRAVVYKPRARRAKPIGESEAFKWTMMAEPEAGARQVEAVRTLAAALLEAGWESAGRGAAWWAQRFVWRHEQAPPARVEPKPDHPAKPGR